MNERENKRGQVTVFVIMAIMIIVAVALVYFFFPQIKSSIIGETKSPSNYIQSCLEEDIYESAQILSAQGGSLDPEHYILYGGENIEYLCYTNQYYETCTMQQPMLKQHIENEIKNSISQTARECFDALEKSYESKGYDVSLRRGDMSVELLPKRIVISFNNSMTLRKDGSENYNMFRVILNNNLYELVSITNSILNWEASYGDSETTTYMDYYHDLKVEKKKQSEGSTIYILTDRNTLNKFQFASRSVAWPPGIRTK